MKTLLNLLFLFLSTACIAQVTIQANTTTSSQEGLDTDFEIVAKIMLTNTSNEAKTFTWTRNEEGLAPCWRSSVCDNVMCWAQGVGTKIFELGAGESGIMDMHLDPNAICGEGSAEILVTDNNDEDNFILLNYNFVALNADSSACDDTCINSSKDILKLSHIDIFPNPMNKYFTLSKVPTELKIIDIYNILGKKVKSFDAESNTNYNISDLARGMYLVNLTNAQGENLNTLKIYKN